MEDSHELRIKHLCYLVNATFLSKQLTEKEKYEMIRKHGNSIVLEAEDRLARCHYGYRIYGY